MVSSVLLSKYTGRCLSFEAVSVEARSAGGVKVGHKMLGLKNRVR